MPLKNFSTMEIYGVCWNKEISKYLHSNNSGGSLKQRHVYYPSFCMFNGVWSFNIRQNHHLPISIAHVVMPVTERRARRKPLELSAPRETLKSMTASLVERQVDESYPIKMFSLTYVNNRYI